MLLVFFACGPSTADGSHRAAGSAEIVVGPAQVCDNPVAGVDRLTEVGAARGFDPSRYAEDFDPLTPEGPTNGYLVSADLDGDADPDLLVGRPQAASLLYENRGNEGFVERGELTGIGPGLITAMVAIAEPDRELPTVIAVMGERLVRFRAASPWVYDAPEVVYTDTAEPHPTFLTFALGDLDGDEDLDVALPVMTQEDGDGAPARILAFDGDMYALTHLLQSGEARPKCQVAGLTDRDGDGDMDVYFPSDRGPPGAFWRNDGPDSSGALQLVDDAADIGAALVMGAMGWVAADLNGDVSLDYCMGDVGPPRCLVSAGDGYADAGPALGLEVAEPIGLADTVGWSIELVDLDADGHPELAQSSGPFGGTPGDPDAELEEAIGAWPDLLWRGGPSGFEDVTAETGFGDLRPHYGLITVDTLGDGYPEVLVHGPQGAPVLYDNPCGDGAWLTVDFEGPRLNPDAWGVQVQVVAEGQAQVREMSNLRARSQGPSELYFGLGDVDQVEQLVVVWPGGERSVFQDLPVRRKVTIRHPDAE